MKALRILSAVSFLALVSCGGAPDEPEAKQSALGFVVGTHRATGSYSCNIPGGRATFSVVTSLYLAQTTIAGRWSLYLNNVTGTGAGVTLNVRDSSPIEARDNGAVVYNVPSDTIYVHRLTTFAAIEYSHDEYAPSAAIQVTPVTPAHPYGQLVIAMYPQGASDPVKGECAEPVVMYLEIQP